MAKNRFSLWEPEKGIATVAVFLASWCVPCQEQIDFFKDLKQTFEPRYTKFVYIFAHDMEQDAQAFIREHQLSGDMLLADVKLMDTFHLPNLPSVYVGDRFGWLSWRALNIKESRHAALSEFLDLITAL